MSDETPSKDRPASPERPEDGPHTSVPAPAPPADDDRARDGEEPGPTDDSAPVSRPDGDGDGDGDGDDNADSGGSDSGEAGTPATGGSVPLGDVSSIEDAPDRSGREIEPARPVVTTTPGPTVPAGDFAPDPAHDIEQRKREAGVNQRFPFGRPGQPLGNAHPFVFGFTGALGVITAWLLVRAAANAQSVIIMIVVAMFLAVGLNPAVERLKRVGLSRGWAVSVVFLGVLLFFAGFVASLVPPLTEQITALTQNVPQYIQQLQNNPKIADWDRRYQLLQQAQNKINDPNFQEALAKRAYDVGKVALSGTFQTLTILILTLYFLGSLPQIKTFFYQLAPRSRRARVALLGDEILNRIGGYVAGQFTIAFICGLTTYIFLEILGVPYALALALIVAVTDLIPLIGATIGAVIVTFVAFLTGVPEGIASLVFYVIYQQVENYLVYPRVMKRTVDVQPAVTVVAALVGGALLGVIGALLAIPTAAAISLVIREVFMPRQESL
ncbi:AI-2E family transporter [Actinomadura viridis]|uniref:AI-2E family transporter n=1 Tax=Actinomadura viridis TaxID=58110 RepID=UPI00367E9AE1